VNLGRILKEVCKSSSLKEGDLLVSGRDHKISRVRMMAAWLVMECGAGTLRELSRRTARDVATLSSAAKRLQIRSRTELDLAARMRNLLEALS
jgi:putative transposase